MGAIVVRPRSPRGRHPRRVSARAPEATLGRCQVAPKPDPQRTEGSDPAARPELESFESPCSVLCALIPAVPSERMPPAIRGADLEKWTRLNGHQPKVRRKLRSSALDSVVAHLQPLPELRPDLGIQSSEGFVEQKQAWPHGQRPRESDPLALSS